MKRIIVNADDFGINESVTVEIERLAELGAISSTTVMANGTCLEEVRRFAHIHPELSYGVHLCLSEFGSITKNRGLLDAGLIDEDGNFVHMAVFSSNSLYNTRVRRAIKEELNAQLDVVSSLGFDVSHADSHHHVHTIYSLREVFADVLHERGVKKVRLGAEFRSWRMRVHLRLWLQRINLNNFYRSQFQTTNSFYSLSDYYQSSCQIKEWDIIELMCHPGHPGEKYQREIKLLELYSNIYNDDIKLITYNDI